MVRLLHEVVIVRGPVVIRRKFEDRAQALAYRDALVARFGPEGVTDFRLNDPVETLPKGWKPSRKGELFCPFCARGRKFVHVERRDVTCCGVCGISTRNWFVRKVNGLWNDV